MKFPTTVVEALSITDDDLAEEILYQLEDAVMDKLPADPPEDFDSGEARWMLAAAIDMLNRFSQHPANPFGTGGWTALVPDQVEEVDETEENHS